MRCRNRKDSLKQSREPFRYGNGPTVLDETVEAFRSANNLHAHAHGVRKLKLHLRKAVDSDFHLDDVLEGRGAFVVAADGNDRRKHAFGLDFVETIAQLVEEVDAGFLHDTDIVGMVRHTHSVTFIVSDFVFVCMHNIGFQ